MPGDGEVSDHITAPGRQQDGYPAHGGRAPLALVGLRALLPDLLPEALTGENADQVRREQDRGEQRDAGGDQDGAHLLLPPNSASATRSNPNDRDALISTTSPAASSPHSRSTAAGTSGTSAEPGTARCSCWAGSPTTTRRSTPSRVVSAPISR